MSKMKLVLTLIAVLLFGVLITVLLFNSPAQTAAVQFSEHEEEEIEYFVKAFNEGSNVDTPSYIDAIDYGTKTPLSLKAQAALALIGVDEGNIRQFFPLITVNGDIPDKEKLAKHIERLAAKEDGIIIKSIDEIPEKDRTHCELTLTLLDFTRTYTEEDGINIIIFEALKRSNRDKDAYFFCYSARHPMNGLYTTYKVKLVNGKWELRMMGVAARSCG